MKIVTMTSQMKMTIHKKITSKLIPKDVNVDDASSNHDDDKLLNDDDYSSSIDNDDESDDNDDESGDYTDESIGDYDTSVDDCDESVDDDNESNSDDTSTCHNGNIESLVIEKNDDRDDLHINIITMMMMTRANNAQTTTITAEVAQKTKTN